MSRIVIEDVEVAFAGRRVLECVSLEVEAGEIAAVCGGAGAGKSTLLAALAGLERPTRGRIATGEGRRPIAGLSAQHPVFAPHRPVMASLAAPLHARHLDLFQRLPWIGRRLPGSRAARVQIDLELRQAARALDVQPLLGRPPVALSGSERRRLSVAGAIAAAEDVLLIDEPYSDLDAAQRLRLRDVLRAFARSNGVAVIVATNDAEVARDLSDSVVRLVAGRVGGWAGAPAGHCAAPAAGPLRKTRNARKIKGLKGGFGGRGRALPDPA